MRMWEIREGHYDGRKKRHEDYEHEGYGRSRSMGHMKDEDLKEAYECGYEDGYEDAMKELEHKSYGRMKRY